MTQPTSRSRPSRALHPLRRRLALRGLVLLGLLAGALGGCAGAPPPVPPGITLLEPEVPPPSEELVREAQRRLRARGLYTGVVDGELGPRTRIALIRLQREAGLDQTGRLDWPTATALGLSLEGERPPTLQAPPPPEGLAPLPGALALLEGEGRGPLPQPPPGALEEARRGARALLEAARVAAEQELLRAGGDGAEEGGGPVDLGAERRLRAAQSLLASARAEAFRRLLEARRAGGWALLPAPMIQALEEELIRRRLRFGEPDGRLDPEDQAAIRWLERSLGLPPTGLPSAPLFDALGLDTSPLFEE